MTEPSSASQHLLQAAVHRDLAGVRQALDQGADVDACSSHDAWRGANALHHAINGLGDAKNVVPVVQALLDRGATVDLADAYGATALMLAVRLRDMGAAYLLLNAKADPNTQDHQGVTLLERALNAPTPGMLSTLLSAGTDPNVPVSSGATVLAHAVISPLGEPAEQVYVMSLLLAAGADPHRSGAFPLQVNQNPTLAPSGRWWPLHVAAHHHRTALVERLLQAGADPSFVVEAFGTAQGPRAGGGTALDVARSTGAHDCVTVLERRELRQLLAASGSPGSSDDRPPAPGRTRARL